MRPASSSSVLASTRQTAGHQLHRTHSEILTKVPCDAEAVPHLSALECNREACQGKATSQCENTAMLVKSLDLGVVVAWVEVETLRGAAVKEAWTAIC